jgi:antirestriction protein ArdC
MICRFRTFCISSIFNVADAFFKYNKHKIMKTNNDNKDTYQRITDYVIDQLEKGEIVWQKNWNSLGLPKNIVTNHYYKGWNIFFLNFVTAYHGYKTPYFITYKQALDKGGTICRGQKGFQVVWWATIEDKSHPIKNENGEEKYSSFRVPKIHTVFNIDQTYGIAFPKAEKLFRSHTLKINECEKIISNMCNVPLIKHDGDNAFYNRDSDFIMLPNIETFHSDEAYYKTLFHELAHSTGHKNRLNRKELIEYDGFGKENYSKEELTAELTAAYLCAVCGIEQETITNSVAYLQGWMKALKNDKRLILKAASQAQAATDYILNNHLELLPEIIVHEDEILN